MLDLSYIELMKSVEELDKMDQDDPQVVVGKGILWGLAAIHDAIKSIP